MDQQMPLNFKRDDNTRPGLTFREFSIVKRDGESPPVDAESRVVSIALSSEEPYRRYDWFENAYYDEILDHGEASIRLGRLRNGAPFLMDHDARIQIGAIIPASVAVGKDRVLRMDVKLSRSAKAQEVMDDINDGIRSKVSVGYQIHGHQLEGEKDGIKTYRITDWEPYEGSSVAIPADDTVGIGRAWTPTNVSPGGDAPAVKQKPGATAQTTEESKKMDKELNPGGASQATTTPAGNVIEITTAARTEGQTAERNRIRQIQAAADKMPALATLAKKAIEDGTPLEEFNQRAVDHLATHPANTATPSDLDLTPKEVRSYRIMNAINAQMPGANRSRYGLEIEASNAIAKRCGKDPQGLYIPGDIQRRDLSAGTATDGAELVGVDHLGGSFVDLLRAYMAIYSLGTTVLSGLVGDVSIPKQTAGSTGGWIATEGDPAAETEAQFSSISLAPKTVGTFTDITRDLRLQSDPSIDGIVQRDLAMAVAQAIDIGAINGSGASGQPTGILNQAGIGDVAGGVNGLAPAWTHIVKIWEEVAKDNALMGSLGWLINAVTASKLMQTEKASSTGQFILNRAGSPEMFGEMLGYQVAVSNNVPSNLTKGTGTNLSAIIFGNFADLILAEWGDLDLLVDPYTASSSGTVRIRVFKSVDVGVRNAQSFAAMQDAITT